MCFFALGAVRSWQLQIRLMEFSMLMMGLQLGRGRRIMEGCLRLMVPLRFWIMTLSRLGRLARNPPFLVGRRGSGPGDRGEIRNQEINSVLGGISSAGMSAGA